MLLDPFLLLAVLPSLAGAVGWLVGFGRDSVGLYSALRKLTQQTEAPPLLRLSPPKSRQDRERIEELYGFLAAARPLAESIIRRQRWRSFVLTVPYLFLAIVIWVVVVAAIRELTPVVVHPVTIIVFMAIFLLLGYHAPLRRRTRTMISELYGRTLRSMSDYREHLHEGFDRMTQLVQGRLSEPVSRRLPGALRISGPEEQFLEQYLKLSGMVKALEAYLLHVQLKLATGNLRIAYLGHIVGILEGFVLELRDEGVLASPANPTGAAPSLSDQRRQFEQELVERGLHDLIAPTPEEIEQLIEALEKKANDRDSLRKTLSQWAPIKNLV